MRPDFKKISLESINKGNFREWEKKQGIEKDWTTAEKIGVKPVYGPDDLLEMEHLGYAAGFRLFSEALTVPCT